MARLSRKQMNKLKEQYGVDVIYSFSRYNNFIQDPYSYYLTYLRHAPQKEKQSIYSLQGTAIHEILQDYLEGKTTYEEMLDRYEETLMQINLDGYMYDCSDKDRNKNIADKYEESIRLFFKNYQPTGNKYLIEKPVVVKIGRFLFLGYIDLITRTKEGKFQILDIKSSSIYKGEKKKKESSQLLIYAQAIRDKFNVPLSQIECKWLFCKYVTVEVDLKTIDRTTGKNKIKEKDCLRTTWVKEAQGDVKKWLEVEYNLDFLELEDALQTCIERNSLELYPKVMQHFRLSDCYVDVDVSEESVNELNDKIIKTLTEVEEKTETAKEYLEIINTSDNDDEIKYFEKLLDELFWVDIKQSDEYYYWNLCNYDRTQHKPWNEYLNNKSMFKKDKQEDDDDVFNW